MTEKWTIKKVWCGGCQSDTWQSKQSEDWWNCQDSFDGAISYVDGQLAAEYL